MKKIKVSLLVKGDIIASGNVTFAEKKVDTNGVYLTVDRCDTPEANPILDLSETVVIEGDMRVRDLNALRGVVIATGDVVAGSGDTMPKMIPNVQNVYSVGYCQ